MIISRTPFRISFFGGGTDYPVWYNEHGGAVLTTSVNKYCYVTVRYLPPFFDYKYRIRYTKREVAQNVSEIKHPSVRECLAFLDFDQGVEIQHNSDLPARIGLGSSSSFTVGLLNALYALKGKMTTKRQLALNAIHVEQNLIKENVGSQDQVAAAFGGLNKIEFGREKKIYVQPVTISQEKLNYFQDCLMLFFTGFSRRASEIEGEQIKKTPEKSKELKAMKEMVGEAINILNGGSDGIKNFGKLLHETWKIKRSLASLMSTSKIDDIYEAAIRAGALGGKLCGAGGGGFILFFALPENQVSIKEKLRNLLYVPFRFETLGSQVIMYAPQDFF